MGDALGFGIPQLDAIVAPIPAKTSVLFLSDPGVAGEPFAYQVAHAHLGAGRKVLYFVANRAPSSVGDALEEFGYLEKGTPKGLLFIDAFSALMGVAEDVAYRVDDPKDLDGVLGVLKKAAKDHPDAVLVLDGLSTLVDNTTVEHFIKRFKRLRGIIEEFPLTIALFTKWPYPEELTELFSEFDGVVTIKGVEDRITYGQYFAVERASWIKDADTRPRLFKTIKPGGVFVYIPKIVVSGPHNAGKSNFVHSVSDSAVSADRLGTTVALDHGRIIVNGVAADLFGTPGQERFDSALKTIAGQALGVIILVDSTKPDTFTRARAMLEMTWKDGLPAVIGANKQDQPNAMSPEEVAELMAPPDGVPVLGCVGKDRTSSRKIIDSLLDRIMRVS
jgi:hypothetical protein